MNRKVVEWIDRVTGLANPTTLPPGRCGYCIRKAQGLGLGKKVTVMAAEKMRRRSDHPVVRRGAGWGSWLIRRTLDPI